MKYGLFSICIFFVLYFCNADPLVWQLGIANGDNKEFAVPYRSWEYGRVPKQANNPNINHQSMTSHYTLPGNKIIRNPEIPSALSSRWVQHVMPRKEVVTDLEISWNEIKGGTRKVSFHLSGYSCYFPNLKGIMLSSPDDHVHDFGIPQKTVDKNAGLVLKSIFSVKAGKNTLRLGINTPSKMYRIPFDTIKLEKMNQVPEYETLLRFSPARFPEFTILA